MTDRVARLEEAVESALNELGWFVRRRKNLAEQVDGTETERTWADVMDEDLDILRKALKGED